MTHSFLPEYEQYMLELRDFYAPHFPSLEDADIFIQNAIQLDWDDRKPRQMLFQVQRFVSLATEIDNIRPKRDGLRMLFIKCCMESLAKLSNMTPPTFYKSFATCFSVEANHYILNNFSLSFIEQEKRQLPLKEGGKLTIEDILTIIKAMRNMVVHEGNYWEMQFFAHDTDSTWLADIETSEQLLSKTTYNNLKQSVTYHFETTLQYEKFIHYFVESCKNFISNYMQEKFKQRHL